MALGGGQARSGSSTQGAATVSRAILVDLVLPTDMPAARVTADCREDFCQELMPQCDILKSLHSYKTRKQP